MTSKYRNKKVVYEGEVFDSKRELRRYQELLLLEKAGCISGLKRQVKYLLIPKQKGADGKVVERECSYVADFVYGEDGKVVVEDVKGFRKKESYIIKRKLMLHIHGIRIKEV